MRQNPDSETTQKSSGGIILCGGRSQRMGRDKPTIPFGPETLIERTINILGSLLSPLVVVAHEDQPLPALPDNVTIVTDDIPNLGPMGGLLTGLSEMRKISPETEYAFVSSCDAPFLKQEFISRMLDLANTYEIAVPYDGKYHHSLSAVYQINVVDKIRNMIAKDQLRPFHLFEESHTHRINCDELREVDPELDSLINTNTPQEYENALKKAGFPIPER